MLGTYAATTAHIIHKYVPCLLQKERLTIHWVGASIGEVDSLPTVEVFLLHQLPKCLVRPGHLVCASHESTSCPSIPKMHDADSGNGIGTGTQTGTQSVCLPTSGGCLKSPLVLSAFFMAHRKPISTRMELMQESAFLEIRACRP
jgi:hypothetical protein